MKVVQYQEPRFGGFRCVGVGVGTAGTSDVFCIVDRQGLAGITPVVVGE